MWGDTGQPQWPVAVGVELGEFSVDVDGVGAVEVHGSEPLPLPNWPHDGAHGPGAGCPLYFPT